MKIEAEIGVIQLQKGTPRTDSNHQELGRGKKGFFPETSEGVWPCKYPGFGLPASITMTE